MRKVIFDGDMGGDDLWALTILVSLVKKREIDLLGITTCFGNTNVAQATRNVLNMLDLLEQPQIPVYQGEDKPLTGLPPLLDGAFGDNGLSLSTLPSSPMSPQSQNAVSYITDTLNQTNDHITLISTGPATNLAKLFKNYPELDRDTVDILWFGGSICPAGPNHLPMIEEDGEPRIGNITKYAEFNAINDPVAAQILADLKNTSVTYVPMDATQHMDISLHKITGFLGQMDQVKLLNQAKILTLMLHDVAGLDEAKFNAKGCYIHDAQVIQYFMNPDLFLPRVAIKDIEFINDHNKAEEFDAIASEFDFSLLGHHGQMHAKQSTEFTNQFIVPGLTTFTAINDLNPKSIAIVDKMANDRWNDLVLQIIDGCK